MLRGGALAGMQQQKLAKTWTLRRKSDTRLTSRKFVKYITTPFCPIPTESS
jgi:hypothetical protein